MAKLSAHSALLITWIELLECNAPEGNQNANAKCGQRGGMRPAWVLYEDFLHGRSLVEISTIYHKKLRRTIKREF